MTAVGARVAVWQAAGRLRPPEGSSSLSDEAPVWLLGLLRPTRAQGLGVRVARAALDALVASHVGITVTGDGTLTPIDCGDDLGAILDEQQFNLGDGPTFEAAQATAPVIADDLAPGERSRYPLFGSVATGFGIRSVVAVPLRIGAARLGVLSAYRPDPGGLDAQQYTDALVLARVATGLLLDEQAALGQSDVGAAVNEGLLNQSVVHQAAGMLSEQLGVPVIEALVRIRAHAVVTGQPVQIVGRSIVAGQLVLER